MKIVCPKCKGNGTVFNPECLLMTVMVPFVMLLDSMDDNDHGKMSKKRCPLCNGKKLLNVS